MQGHLCETYRSSTVFHMIQLYLKSSNLWSVHTSPSPFITICFTKSNELKTLNSGINCKINLFHVIHVEGKNLYNFQIFTWHGMNKLLVF